MLNLDMVGRANGAVDVSGLDAAPSMEADLTAAVEGERRARSTIKREGPGAGRSDDYNFLVRRIPAINFFTGFHNDYHRPGDDWEKIDAAGTARVASAGARVRRALANRTARPEFVLNANMKGGSDDPPAVSTWRPDPLRIRRRRAVEREARCERLQPLAQHQPAAMQARLQRLVLHACSRVLASSVVSPSMSRRTTGTR